MKDLVLYIPNWYSLTLNFLLKNIPWESRTETRSECFMSDPVKEYTYGKGKGIRSYTSVPYIKEVKDVMNDLNERTQSDYNGCFLNRYDHQLQHLGWHSDDFIEMDQNHPVASISFGEPREIWWRVIGETGEVPDDQKQLLEHGSLFVMPPGFQLTHQHRIPKGSKEMKERVSLTFRKFFY